MSVGTRVGDRFEVGRKLGEGGMGVVHEGWDRIRQVPVALKTLRNRDPDALVRLKNEFRALADLSHPNLVSFYGLDVDEQGCVLSMELVDGLPLVQWVRGGAETPTRSSGETAATIDFDVMDPADPPEGTPIGRRGTPPADLDRIRTCFRQLAEAVHVLHQARRLHRDLKPSNVLVTLEGRVVVLDFGLVSALRLDPDERRSEAAVGTIDYMAPEQSTGLAPTPAADWYSVGVMLFEALTGLRPYEGTLPRVLHEKQYVDVTSPAELCEGLPADLVNLCEELLERNPRSRPKGPEIVARLGGAVPHEGSLGRLIGRERHLAYLRDAWRQTPQGVAVVRVRGRSGVGKTYLSRHFLSSLPPEVTVLRGRCYEREAVAYNAFDSLVDDLSQRLMALSASARAQLIDADVSVLARLFPALTRVSDIAEAAEVHVADVHERRRRGFASLVHLLRGLAPVVVHLDDVQWGDTDSARLLRELIGSDLPMLVLLSYRSEEEADSEFLRSTERAIEESGVAARTVEVDVLSSEEAFAFAAALIGDARPVETIEEVARESGGSPLFVEVLSRYVQEGAEGAAAAANLDAAIADRAAHMPDRARQLIETLAVAGRPLDLGMAAEAAGIDDVLPVVDELRFSRFVHTSGDRIEVYHDRVREAVVARLAPLSLQNIHHRLAEGLACRDDADDEALMRHWEGAGHRARAAPHALAAARAAATALAFDRAAELFETALRLGSWNEEVLGGVQEQHAQALARSGRCEEAARAYLLASQSPSDPLVVLELRRHAAVQFLGGGMQEEGLAVAQPLFRAVGLRLFRNPLVALLSMLLTQLRLWLRGLDFTPAVESPPPEEIFRIDLCRSIAEGINVVDVVQANDLLLRGLLRSLRVGDRGRAGALLAHYAAALVGGSAGERRQFPEVLRRSREAIEGAGEDRPVLEAEFEMGCTAIAYFQGHFEETVQRGRRSEGLLLQRSADLVWHLVTARQLILWGLTYRGGFAELTRESQRMFADARERGNLRFQAGLLDTMAWVGIAGGRSSEALATVNDCMERWPQERYQLQHYGATLARTLLHLSSGEVKRAWSTWEDAWPHLRRSLLMFNRFVFFESWQVRGRVSAALYRTTADRKALRLARRSLRKLRADPDPWVVPTADALEALIVDEEAGLILMRQALAGFEATDMAAHAAAARCWLGRRVGGDEGDTLRATAESWAAREGVVDLDAMARAALLGCDG